MFKIKAIVPRHPVLDPKDYEQAIRSAFEISGRQFKAQMEQTVRTWNKPAQFRISPFQKTPHYFRLGVGTDNKIWGYIDKGTPTRYIVPRRKKVLRFFNPFSAKTTPGLLNSKTGLIGKTPVFAKRVKHRIKARGFSKKIAREGKLKVKIEMDRAFRTIVRRAK